MCACYLIAAYLLSLIWVLGCYLHDKWYQSPWWCAAKVVRCLWSLPNKDRESLNNPHTKILKIYIYILLMVLNNGVIQNSHEHGRAGFPWMCVQGWHVVPMDGVRETHGWRVDKVKSPLGKWEWVGLVHGPQRDLKAHRKVDSHVRRRLLGYMCEWSPTLNKDEKNE